MVVSFPSQRPRRMRARESLRRLVRETDLAPRQLASKGIVVTQLDLGSIARLGLIKIDLLGIRGLTVLGDLAPVIAHSNGSRDERPESALAPLEAIPDGDGLTRDLVAIAHEVMRRSVPISASAAPMA